jgi:hypothetical protein
MIMVACLSSLSSSAPLKETNSERDVSRNFVIVPNPTAKSKDIWMLLCAEQSAVLFPLGKRDVYFSKMSPPDPGPTQLPIQWALGFFFSGIKRQGGEVNHSSTSSTKVKNEWRHTSIPNCMS